MSSFASPPRRQFRVAVLAGGPSEEREISLQSGAAVERGLAARGHQVQLIDPVDGQLPELDPAQIDVAFIALHGRCGEDGDIQRQLQRLQIPFTGSSAEACELTFSKSAAKERLLLNSVPTAPYVLIHETDDAAHIQAQAQLLGYPLVVKPDTQGSSLGVSIVRRAEDLPQALVGSFHYDSFCVLERYIPGTEWTMGMIDTQVLPLIRIEPERSFYDFEAKYSDEATRFEIEPDEPAAVLDAIESVGRQARRSLGTNGLMRIDLRLDNYGQPWVLELNTVPGLTDHSLVPQAAAHLGLDLGQLCEVVIGCAIESNEYSARGA